mgnify:CR=1 FL=1
MFEITDASDVKVRDSESSEIEKKSKTNFSLEVPFSRYFNALHFSANFLTANFLFTERQPRS